MGGGRWGSLLSSLFEKSNFYTFIFLDWQRSKKRGDSIEEDDSSREREEVFETIELDELK